MILALATIMLVWFGVQVVLLHLLANQLLQYSSLKDLVGLLLRAQLDQKRLIDALQGSHFRMLGWAGGM